MGRLIELGQIRTTYGLNGEVRVFLSTDFPKLRFKKGNQIKVIDENGKVARELTVKSLRESGEYCFLSFDEITDVDEAKKIRGLFLAIDEDNAPMPKGYYRLGELIGFKAVDSITSAELGTVIDVLTYLPRNTLKIEKENGQTFTVPMVDAFIKNIDFESHKIQIEVIEGLL